MGPFGKGNRNNNGEYLIDFLNEKNLYITNTHFRHKPSHTSTWHAPEERRDRNGKRIHNLIDYIIVPKSIMKAVKNARAVQNLAHESDHSLVVAEINFNLLNIYVRKYRNVPRKQKYDTAILANDKDLQEKYITKLNQNIQQTLPLLNETNLIQYNNTLTNIIQKTVKQIIPKAPIYKNGKIKFYHDNILTQTS
jgi:hypothetical protein